MLSSETVDVLTLALNIVGIMQL